MADTFDLEIQRDLPDGFSFRFSREELDLIREKRKVIPSAHTGNPRVCRCGQLNLLISIPDVEARIRWGEVFRGWVIYAHGEILIKRAYAACDPSRIREVVRPLCEDSDG